MSTELNIENIMIKGETYRQEAIGDITTKELDISSSDESLINWHFGMNIYKMDEDFSNKIETIGNLELTYIDINMAESVGFSIEDALDLESTEKYWMYDLLFNDEGCPNPEYVGIDEGILYVDRFYIEKKYRNKGVGSKIISELPRLIRTIFKLHPGCIVILANPYEIAGDEYISSEDKNEIEHLIKFYENNGYTRIKDTPFVVKNMDFE